MYLAEKLNRPPHVLLNALFIVLAIILVVNPQDVSAMLSDLIIFLPLFLTSLDHLQGIEGARDSDDTVLATKLRVDLWISYTALIIFETSVGRDRLNDNMSLYWIIKVGLMFSVYLFGRRGPPMPDRRPKKQPPPLVSCAKCERSAELMVKVLAASNFSSRSIPLQMTRALKQEYKQSAGHNPESQAKSSDHHERGLPPARPPSPRSPEPPCPSPPNAPEVAESDDTLDSEEEDSGDRSTDNIGRVGRGRSSVSPSADYAQASEVGDSPATEDDSPTIEAAETSPLNEERNGPLHSPSQHPDLQYSHPGALSVDIDDAEDADVESTGSSPGSASSAFATILRSKTVPRSSGAQTQEVNIQHPTSLQGEPQNANPPEAVPQTVKTGFSGRPLPDDDSARLEEERTEQIRMTTLSNPVGVPT